MQQGGFFTDMAVHPAAAVFPMLGDDELRELAEDIKANGLLHPIILDADGVLIDGRNRFAACNLAGVEPEFKTLPDGVDPVAYILSENIRRRHMSKGQQAMAIAQMLELEGGRYTGARALTFATKVTETRLSYAVSVLRYAPDKADSVREGFISLDEAYAEARGRKNAASSLDSQVSRLRTEAPDLADLVTEERMTLRDALAALEQRIRDERERRRASTQATFQALLTLAPPSYTAEQAAEEMAALYDPRFVEESYARRGQGVTAARARLASETLAQLAVRLAAQEEHHGRS